MLKYRIHPRQFHHQDNQLNVTNMQLNELFGVDADYSQLLICETPDIKSVYEGSVLLVVVKKIIREENGEVFTDHTFNSVTNLTVSAINRETQMFTAHVRKYITLNVSAITLTPVIDTFNGNENTWYVYFYFRETHFFEKNEDVKLTIHCYDNNGKDCFVVLSHVEYVDYSTLRIKRDDLTNDLIFGLLFDGVPSTENGVVANLQYITVMRSSFLFDGSSAVTFHFDRPLYSFNIALQQNFETNMMQSEGLRTHFVDTKKREAINPTVDMERDVYYPVIKKSTVFEPVYRIKFNLHFREHRGNDWVAKPESFWNGTAIKEVNVNGESKQRLVLMNESANEQFAYFSYPLPDENNETETSAIPPYKDGASCQSDLLQYLNFTNNDVKYQKNRLKKSFLRLSFYDNKRPTEQNLLHYSTIYMNSGSLFNKYIQDIETEPFSKTVYDVNQNTYKSTLSNIGCKVNTEPYENLVETTNFDEIEEHRMSSQIVVYDKYNSMESSEGFYLYLWKENGATVPQDIYMKVEFNHAGYGRSIPFMMPYWDKNKWPKKENEDIEGKEGIKTFQEIIDDWNEGVCTDGQYGVQQYIKFSHIHLKYQYDIHTNRFIYYLDPEEYGYNSVSFENNEIVFNLYEAKVGGGQSVATLTATGIDNSTVVTGISYEIKLSYPYIDATGGSVEPEYTIFQITEYADGSSKRKIIEEKDLGRDINKTFEFVGTHGSVEINSNTGLVTHNDMNTDSENPLAKVKLTIKYDGQSIVSNECEIRQYVDLTPTITSWTVTGTITYEVASGMGGYIKPTIVLIRKDTYNNGITEDVIINVEENENGTDLTIVDSEKGSISVNENSFEIVAQDGMTINGKTGSIKCTPNNGEDRTTTVNAAFIYTTPSNKTQNVEIEDIVVKQEGVSIYARLEYPLISGGGGKVAPTLSVYRIKNGITEELTVYSVTWDMRNVVTGEPDGEPSIDTDGVVKYNALGKDSISDIAKVTASVTYMNMETSAVAIVQQNVGPEISYELSLSYEDIPGAGTGDTPIKPDLKLLMVYRYINEYRVDDKKEIELNGNGQLTYVCDEVYIEDTTWISIDDQNGGIEYNRIGSLSSKTDICLVTVTLTNTTNTLQYEVLSATTLVQQEIFVSEYCTVELSYNDIPGYGGEVTPTLIVKYWKYNVDEKKYDEEPIDVTDEDVDKYYEIDGFSLLEDNILVEIDEDNGKITYDNFGNTLNKTKICDVYVSVRVIVDGNTFFVDDECEVNQDIAPISDSLTIQTFNYDIIDYGGGSALPSYTIIGRRVYGAATNRMPEFAIITKDNLQLNPIFRFISSKDGANINRTSGDVTYNKPGEYGNITGDSEVGEVELNITCKGYRSSTKSTTKVKQSDIPYEELEWGEVIVELSYGYLPGDGGSTTPFVIVNQKAYYDGQYITTVTIEPVDYNQHFTYIEEIVSDIVLDEDTGEVTRNDYGSVVDTTDICRVECTITSHGVTGSATALVTQGKASMRVIDYGDVVVSLYYDDIHSEGGSTNPTLLVMQECIYTDGHKVFEKLVDSQFTASYELNPNYLDATIDEDTGIVTYEIENTDWEVKHIGKVKATVVGCDGHSGVANAIVLQDVPPVVAIGWGELEITLTYPDIPSAGGNVFPQLIVEQERLYNNGTSEMKLLLDGEYTYSYHVSSFPAEEVFDGITGEVGWSQKNLSTDNDLTICRVRVSVTAHEVVEAQSCDIIQKHTKPIGWGIINATLSYEPIPGNGGSSSPNLTVKQNELFDNGEDVTHILTEEEYSVGYSKLMGDDVMIDDKGNVTKSSIGDLYESSTVATVKAIIGGLGGHSKEVVATVIQDRAVGIPIGWGDVIAELSYPIIPSAGQIAYIYPTLTVQQYRIYNDGSSLLPLAADEYQTSTYVVSNKINSKVQADSQGRIQYNQKNLSDINVIICTETVTVTGHPSTDGGVNEVSVSVNVEQAAAQIIGYGELNATLSYEPIPGNGGSSSPNLTVRQNKQYDNGFDVDFEPSYTVAYSDDYLGEGVTIDGNGVVNKSTIGKVDEQTHVATVSAVVTVEAPGFETKTCTVNAVVMQEGIPVQFTGWGDVHVTLSYSHIPPEGGSITPTLTVQQERKFNNNTTEFETLAVEEYNCSYNDEQFITDKNFSLDESTGVVNYFYLSDSITDDKMLGYVYVTVVGHDSKETIVAASIVQRKTSLREWGEIRGELSYEPIGILGGETYPSLKVWQQFVYENTYTGEVSLKAGDYEVTYSITPDNSDEVSVGVSENGVVTSYTNKIIGNGENRKIGEVTAIVTSNNIPNHQCTLTAEIYQMTTTDDEWWGDYHVTITYDKIPCLGGNVRPQVKVTRDYKPTSSSPVEQREESLFEYECVYYLNSLRTDGDLDNVDESRFYDNMTRGYVYYEPWGLTSGDKFVCEVSVLVRKRFPDNVFEIIGSAHVDVYQEQADFTYGHMSVTLTYDNDLPAIVGWPFPTSEPTITVWQTRQYESGRPVTGVLPRGSYIIDHFENGGFQIDDGKLNGLDSGVIPNPEAGGSIVLPPTNPPMTYVPLDTTTGVVTLDNDKYNNPTANRRQVAKVYVYIYGFEGNSCNTEGKTTSGNVYQAAGALDVQYTMELKDITGTNTKPNVNVERMVIKAFNASSFLSSAWGFVNGFSITIADETYELMYLQNAFSAQQPLQLSLPSVSSQPIVLKNMTFYIRFYAYIPDGGDIVSNRPRWSNDVACQIIIPSHWPSDVYEYDGYVCSYIECKTDNEGKIYTLNFDNGESITNLSHGTDNIYVPYPCAETVQSMALNNGVTHNYGMSIMSNENITFNKDGIQYSVKVSGCLGVASQYTGQNSGLVGTFI